MVDTKSRHLHARVSMVGAVLLSLLGLSVATPSAASHRSTSAAPPRPTGTSASGPADAEVSSTHVRVLSTSRKHVTTAEDAAAATRGTGAPAAQAEIPHLPAGNLTSNPSLERDASGWGGFQSVVTRTALGGAPDGSYVARVARASGTSYSIDDSPDTVPSASAGVVYAASASVRTLSGSRPITLVVRETDSAGAVRARSLSAPIRVGSSFVTLTTSLTATGTGTTIDVYVYQSEAVSGDAFFADLLTLTSSASSSCPSPSPGRRAWPAACWRPFNASSPFNTPLPVAPKLAANSAQVISQIYSHQTGDPHTAANIDGTGGEPTYYSVASDPQFTIHCTRPWGTCPLEGMRVRIPAGARPEGGVAGAGNDSSGDAHITVLDLAAGREYDFWQVQKSPLPAAGGTLNISWGGWELINGTGVDGQAVATAANFASLAGRLRVEEMQSGVINHALFIDIDCDNGTFVYPARHLGYACPDRTNAPPMGARLRLNYTDTEISALPVTAWKKTILRAMAKYGMFFGDTGSGSIFSIEREAGLQYTTMGASADPWWEFGKANGWTYWGGDPSFPLKAYVGRLDDPQIDFRHRLQVIDPCVTKHSC